MQVTELQAQGLKKSLKISVDAAQIEAQTEAELKAAGQKVKIPGFRPGNIPMKVLKQRYGKSVEADVIRQVITNATGDALKEKNYRPATQPEVSLDGDYEEGKALSFSISVEVFPDVPEMKFDGITLSRYVVDVTEADIDDALSRIAERSPDFEPVKKAAKKGNVVVIDFKGSIDGVLFDGGTASDFRLELGSGQFIDGFEAQLEGTKAGDSLDVNVTFPKEYHSKSLAGKPAVFAVTVKEVLEKKTPVIDDAFAKARGFDDVAKIRDAVKTQLSREYDQIIRQQTKKQLFDELDGQYNFELPPSMVEVEFNAIWERLKQAKAEGDPTLVDKSDDELKEEYTEIARRRVKLGILLAEVGGREKIQVTREELGRAVMQQASQFPGQEKQVMDFYRKHPERVQDMRGPILEEKAVDFILGKVKFKDTSISAADLIKLEEEEAEGASKAKKSKAKAKSESDEPKKARAKKKNDSES